MERKTRLRENIAFVLFLILGSAAGSENTAGIGTGVLAALLVLYHAGQAYRKEDYEEQSIMAHDGHGDGGTGCF